MVEIITRPFLLAGVRGQNYCLASIGLDFLFNYFCSACNTQAWGIAVSRRGYIVTLGWERGVRRRGPNRGVVVVVGGGTERFFCGAAGADVAVPVGNGGLKRGRGERR